MGKVLLEEKVYAEVTNVGTLIIEKVTEGPLGQDRIRCIELSSIGAQALLDLLANGEAAQNSVQADVCPQSPDGEHHYYQDTEGFHVVFDCTYCGHRR